METSTEDAAEARGSGTAQADSAVTVEPAATGVDTAGTTPPVAMAPASLSPSRASDFMQCPLLYRFRVIDRLPEKPSEAATRGTLVHAVLERLFDAPAAERTAPRAKSLIPGQWDRLRETRPEVVELFEDDPEGERLARWLGEAEQLVERWFTLEDPTRLEPAERELFVQAELDSGLMLRGIIDRVDVAPTGDVRIVDYKTGKAPRPEYAEGALFQMKFYALVVWRLKNVVPRRLQLVYLGSGDVLTYDPVLADLERVERKLHALWEAIRQATESGDWRPRPTKLCGWCDHQAHCPEFGGTPPPYPLPVTAVERDSAGAGGPGGAARETQPLPVTAVERDSAGAGGAGGAPRETQPLPVTAVERDSVGAGGAGGAPRETQPLPVTAVEPEPAGGPGGAPRETQPLPVRAAESGGDEQGRMGPD